MLDSTSSPLEKQELSDQDKKSVLAKKTKQAIKNFKLFK